MKKFIGVISVAVILAAFFFVTNLQAQNCKSILSTPQNMSTSFADVGSAADTGRAGKVDVEICVDVNSATGWEFQFLRKAASGDDWKYFTITNYDTSGDPYFGTIDALTLRLQKDEDWCFTLPLSLRGNTRFLKMQAKVTADGDPDFGQIDSVSYCTVRE